MNAAPWVVARFRAQYLAKVRYNVEVQGAEIYVPRVMTRVKSSKLLPRPLFPGYAFVRHPEGLWQFLRGTLGIIDVVLGATNDQGDAQPARLPDAEINQIRAREGADGMVRLESSEFKVGEKVRVERGVVSIDVIVDGMSGADRVFVLMEFLGAMQRAEVRAVDITR